jgi:mannosyltransferase
MGPTVAGEPGREVGSATGGGCRSPGGVLAAILGLALALRLIDLGSDLWIDEAAAVTEFARYPWPRLVAGYDIASNHFLNSVLIKLVVSVVGEAEWAVRLPAVLFGVAGVWALWQLAQVVASPREAWGAALLLALSYHHVFFSQNARGYTALLFWSTLATTILIRLRSAPTPAALFGYAGCVLLAIASHAAAVFVWAGHALALLLAPGRGEARRAPAFAAVAGAGVIVAVWNATLVRSAVEYFVVGRRGVAQGQLTGLRLADFATTVREGLGYHALGPFLSALASGLPRTPLVWLALAVAVPLAGLGLARYWRQSPFLVALWVAPGVVLILAVLVLGLGVYPRFFVFLLPPFLLALVRGVVEASRLARDRLAPAFPGVAWRHLPAALLLGAAVGSCGLLPSYYRYPKQDFRGALAYVQAHRAPDEPVATVGLAAVGYRYYAPQLPVVREAAEIDRLCGACPGLWMIYTFPEHLQQHTPALAEELGRRFRIVQAFPGSVGGGAVLVARSERRGRRRRAAGGGARP